MRIDWTIGLVFAAAVATGAAGSAAQGAAQSQGATPQAAQKQGHGDRATEAMKHFAMVNAELENAENQAKMLAAITKRPATYDTTHGGQFATNIRSSLEGAQAHIQHLQPLVKSDAEKKQLKLLQDHTTRAQTQAGKLEAMVGSSEKLHPAALEIEKSADAGLESLKRLAKEMKVQIEVG